MPADRVLLESIKTLNFYTDERTAARRSKPIPQLTCVGKACKLYKPDAVQCFNVGGHGTDVSWKVRDQESQRRVSTLVLTVTVVPVRSW